ncbi:MAG: TonB-dependent receptor [Bacteroidales bacterium]|nr:TonB-dependent receptor [Bacteroidales bacterium]
MKLYRVFYYLVVWLLLLVLPTKATYGQADTIPLSEVVVQSSAHPVVFKQLSRTITVISAEQIASAPVHSLDEILRFYGGVDVRERGTWGVQSDLSMRGGGFDQNLLMLNGVALNDPQTGHHNSSQAIALAGIEKIEVMQGPGTRWFGPNAFSGGFNIITRKPDASELVFDLSGGQYGLIFGDVSVTAVFGKWANTTAVSWHKSAGYAPNTDFSSKLITNESQIPWGLGMLKVYLGYIDKAFGAQAFYSPKYPDQFEQVKSTLVAVHYGQEEKRPFSATFTWRRLNDRFELFREGDGWYHHQDGFFIKGTDTAGFATPKSLYPYTGHNYHRTDVISFNAGTGFDTKVGDTRVGFRFQNESILSNVLGELLSDTVYLAGTTAWYNHGKNRQHVDVSLNHSYVYHRFSLAGGISLHYSSDYGLYPSPGLDMGYFITETFKIYGTVNHSVRLPTFTDLYYSGPDRVSNPNLKPEQAFTGEIGSKMFVNDRFTLSAAVFRRDGKDLIDWGKLNPDDPWQSMNLTRLTTYGFTLGSQYLSPFSSQQIVRYAGLSYTYLSSEKNTSQYLSLYALDYLNHNLTFNLVHRLPLRRLEVSYAYNFRQRSGAYVEYPSGEQVSYAPVHQLNMKITYATRWVKFYVSGRNLLNSEVLDYPYVPQPGRWFVLGATGKIGL